MPTMRLFWNISMSIPTLPSAAPFASTVTSKFIHICSWMTIPWVFIRHDMYLELWEGNYLTKTAQVNLTWDAVAAKIADLIEQGRLMVPIKATPVQQQMEQLTLTPEDSEKAGLPSHEQQVKISTLRQKSKSGTSPSLTHPASTLRSRTLPMHCAEAAGLKMANSVFSNISLHRYFLSRKIKPAG